MRGIAPPGSPEGRRTNTGKLLEQGERRREMTDKELAADLTQAEALALLAYYEAVKRCRGKLAMRLQAAGLLGLPGWAGDITVAKRPTKRGKAVLAEVRKLLK